MSDEGKAFSWLVVALPIAAVAIALIAGFFAWQADLARQTQNNQTPTACTQDSMQCPDGSYVGRTGPNCEFVCPQNYTENWNTVANAEYKFSLKYPDNFFDPGGADQHLPTISIFDCNYQVFPSQCPNVGRQEPAGVTSKLVVNGVNYCLFQTSNAGAGHQYYYDYYVTVVNGKCLGVNLETATTTCENYLPLEQGNIQQSQNYQACINQRNQRPNVLQQIVNTFKFSN